MFPLQYVCSCVYLWRTLCLSATFSYVNSQMNQYTPNTWTRRPWKQTQDHTIYILNMHRV